MRSVSKYSNDGILKSSYFVNNTPVIYSSFVYALARYDASKSDDDYSALEEELNKLLPSLLNPKSLDHFHLFYLSLAKKGGSAVYIYPKIKSKLKIDYINSIFIDYGNNIPVMFDYSDLCARTYTVNNIFNMVRYGNCDVDINKLMGIYNALLVYIDYGRQGLIYREYEVLKNAYNAKIDWLKEYTRTIR